MRRSATFLAVLAALVLAGCAGASTTTGLHGVGAQNRVWALTPAAQLLTRPAAHQSTCSRPDFAVSAAQIAAGFCVATEDATRQFAPIGGGSRLADLAASGQELDPTDAGGQLTRAGRAYAKASEVFGPTSGGRAEINEAGQRALEGILANPETTETVMQGGRFAGGLRFVSPEGIGAVFSPDGTFQYFGYMRP